MSFIVMTKLIRGFSQKLGLMARSDCAQNFSTQWKFNSTWKVKNYSDYGTQKILLIETKYTHQSKL